MRLIGAMEYLIVTIGSNGTMHGLRLQRHHKRMKVVRALEVLPDERSISERLGKLCHDLELTRDMDFVIYSVLPGSVYFQCKMPEMTPRELLTALQLEVPRQILKLPSEWKLQFTSEPADEAGMLDIGVQITPHDELRKFCDLLLEHRFLIDEFISPFLALPKLPAGSRIHLPMFEPDFYWADGSFHPMVDKLSCNDELIEQFRKDFDFQGDYPEENLRRYLAELLIAKYVTSLEFPHRKLGLAVLPKIVRPQRLRSQLRLAVILLVVLVALWIWNTGGKTLKFYSEYSSVVKKTSSYKGRTAELLRRTKSQEKELKEMNRVLEQNLGERSMLVVLADIANVVPTSVLVSNFRLNDSGLEMTFHHTQDNLDIGPALRKISGFKVSTLQNRKVNDTLNMITVKLERTGEVK